MASSSDSEVIAQEVSTLSGRVADIEARLAEVDKVIDRLEGAALTTSRAMQEISHHWDAVYEAMRRVEESDVGQLRGDWDSSHPRKRKA